MSRGTTPGEQAEPAGGEEAVGASLLVALLELTEQLSAAGSHEDVARIVATSGVERLGARAGFVALATDDGAAFEMLSHLRADDPDTPLCRLDTTEQLPVVEAWRFGVAIHLHDADELYSRYPILDRARGDREALAALPLEVDGMRLGAINLTFATPQPFDEQQQQALRVVASLCAQALRRAQLSVDVEQTRRDFAITAAHELRSPLTALYGAAVALAGELPVPAAARDSLMAVVLAQSQRLAGIVNALDLAAGLDSDQVELPRTPVDVGLVLDEVAQFCARTTQLATVRMRVEPNLRAVTADPRRLRQVLMHLVDNACKYSPEASEVQVQATGEDGFVELRVLDVGPGLEQQHLERAFEKFYRADPMQRNGVSGIGLGLYVSRQLVEAMGGRIWLEPRTDVAQGLAACVRLPVWPG